MSKDIDSYDYQRYAILFVDDEATTRKYFRRLFGEKFRILEAEDGVQALEVFKQHADEIGVMKPVSASSRRLRTNILTLSRSCRPPTPTLTPPSAPSTKVASSVT
jgi:CheY-like chemotaxis protein